jgi:CheY-like chemotaxis protein
MPNQTAKTVLIVEDDYTSRVLFREYLEDKNLVVEFAKTGQDALDFFQSHSEPDLIFIDILLPDINGIELAKRLISLYPTISIVAQTAYANLNLEEQCSRVGMKGYITKPLNFNDVEMVLNNFL